MKSLLKYAVIAFTGILLVSCSSPIRLSNYPDSSQDFKSSPNTSAASQRATMRPYTINGKTYYPTTVSVGDTASGIASWYGPDFHGKKTSNGETYNMNAMTAAHKTLPMNTMVRVTNLGNGAQTTVRINDRGPFVAGRIIDLSKAAATSIGMIGTGTARVKLEVVGFYGDGKNYQNTGSLSSPPSVYNSKNWGSGVSGTIITAGISGAMSGGISGAVSSASLAAKSAAKSAANSAIRQAVDKGVQKASQKISETFEKNSNLVSANNEFSSQNSNLVSPNNEFTSSNEASENSANFGKISQGQQSFEGGSFMVQIGAFKRLEGAESFKNSNANKYGYKTLIRTFDIDGEKIYRVFLSGFRSEAEARDFVEAKHFGGAYIVRE